MAWAAFSPCTNLFDAPLDQLQHIAKCPKPYAADGFGNGLHREILIFAVVDAKVLLTPHLCQRIFEGEQP